MSYNLEETAEQLKTITEGLAKHLATPGAVDAENITKIFPFLTLQTTDSRNTKTIHVRDAGSDDSSELVVRTTGVLVNHDLAPRRRSIPPKERLFVRQHITVSGLGILNFTNAVEQISALAEEVKSYYEPGMLTDWSPTQSPCGAIAFDANCRYFSLAGVTHSRDIPFAPAIDPFGILEGSKDNFYIHTVDNVVEFYAWDKDTNSVKDFDPRGFQNGDIVDAHVAFMIVQSSMGRHSGKSMPQQQKHTLLVVLRGLTLIEKNAHKSLSTEKPATTMKPRKRLYEVSPANMEGDSNMASLIDDTVTGPFKQLRMG